MAEPPKDSMEVVLNKNNKLFAALKEKRAEIQELQSKLESSDLVKAQYIEKLGGVDRCWSQLQVQLELGLSRLGQSEPSTSPCSGESYLSSLQKAWRNSDNAPANIEQQMAEQCQKFGKLALDVSEAVERYKTSQPDNAAALNGAQGQLAEVSMQLALYKERAEVAETKLIDKEKEYQECAVQVSVLNRSHHQLREEIEQLKAQLKAQPMPAPADTCAPAESENQNNKDSQELQPALMQLEAELVAVRAESENRMEQISELSAALSSVKQELKAQQIKTLEVADDDVQRHPDFINLNMKLQRGNQELEASRNAIERMKWEKENIEATHSLTVEQTKVHTMEQQHKSDSEFEKLRLQNSQLRAQVDHLTKAADMKQVTPDLVEQFKEQQTLLQSVKEELDRANNATERQKALLEVSEKQCKAAQEQNKDELVVQLNAKLEMKEAEINDYMEEIDDVAKAYEDIRGQNLRLLDQLKSKEDAKTHLIEEKIQAKRIEAMLRAQKEELQRKATTIAEEKEVYVAVQARLEEQLKTAESNAANLMQTEQCLTKLVDSHKTFTNDAMVLYNGTRAKLESKNKAYETLKAQCKLDSDQHEEALRESQRLNEKVHSLTKKLSYYSSHGGGKKSGAEQELKDLKGLVTCKIDNTKMIGLDKFCVITKCYHIFSDSGLQHNLANRNRKCPACQTAFDKADVKTIFIDF